MLFQREDKENTSGCAVFTSQPISLAMAYAAAGMGRFIWKQVWD